MITHAAVKVFNRIYKGRRHGEAIHSAVKAGEIKPIKQDMQGFIAVIDGEEIYLNRKLARQEAIDSGQIAYEFEREGKPLISEELW